MIIVIEDMLKWMGEGKVKWEISRMKGYVFVDLEAWMNIDFFFLPAYHSKCIDPWLTRNRRVCPVCKRKVFAEGEHVSDTESESDPDDTTPLIQPSSYGTQGGTFLTQRVCVVKVHNYRFVGSVYKSR